MEYVFDLLPDDGKLPPDDAPSLAAGALLSDNLPLRSKAIRAYPAARSLTPEQVTHMRLVVDTLARDLDDPAAVETLLVLLEVLYILDVPEYYLHRAFGIDRLRCLRTWGDLVPPKRRPQRLRRAWVWVPNHYNPRIYPIAEDGTLRLYGDRSTPAE